MRTKPRLPSSLTWPSWSERDRSWARLFNSASVWPLVLRVLVIVSRLGDGPLWYGTMVLLPWVGGASGTACALRLLGMGLVNLVVYKALKRCFARPRPFVKCPDIRAGTKSLDEYSFPSGHTLHAVAFSTVLVAYYPAMVWLLWPFTLLVALSRMVLGLHYPSDVLAGVAIGLVSSHVALSFL